ncbi:MAG: hypothetical protein ACOYLO_12490 [Ferruginibacter sp.]
MGKTKIKGEDVGDKSLKSIDIDFSAATEKTVLVDNDSLVINDSVGNSTKRSKLSSLLAYFNAIYNRKSLLQELSSLTDVIPSGFKGLFAKASGLFFKNSDNSIKQLATLDNIPVSLPANGGNADTLDTLHAAAFARFNTAFTTWDNIVSNTPPVHVHVLDATGVLTYQDLFMVLDTNLSDTAPKVFVLQPGTYSISDIIDCSTANLVGIIGLSKHDTIIEIACNEALSNLRFLENLTLKITTAFAGTFLVSAPDLPNTYVKSVSVICEEPNHGNYDIYAFQGFSCIENIDIVDVSGACNECKNISGVTVVNSTVTTATDVLSLFHSCVNLSNIIITHNDFNTMFSKCDNILNVIVNIAGNENSVSFNNCTNLSNCNITGAYIALSVCTVLSNIIVSGATTGIQESSIIANCKTDSCTQFGFADSEKLSNCMASNTVLTGYDRCRGMVNNKADSNTTNYNSCNADLVGLYTVSDTPNGGFNA